MFHFNPQSPPPIHFNLIGNERLRTDQNLPIQLLVLPTLINLNKLDISLYNLDTSLLFDGRESIDLFAIDERHSIIVSTLLKTLIIRKHTSRVIKNFYIYDFLAAFPNLESLHLHSIRFIYDEIGDMFQKDDRWECTKLHHMILQRLFVASSTTSNNQNENDTYKLKHLKITECDIYFGNGLNSFLKKCHQLKRLNLQNIKYVTSTSDITSYIHYAPSSPSFLPLSESMKKKIDMQHYDN
ncbi:hypothetical protein BJ944DRAFT_232782 [Cunninghamella echinulata]|nr:hypothetical protein BJ944DRAFT_232782 [Cunninghamella echinulata]